MFDFCVIGAGIVGGLVARELTKYSKSVVILEKESDVAMGATSANSAIVHAGFDAKEGTLKAKLNVLGSKMMKKVAKELSVPYFQCGSLVVGFGGADDDTLSQLLERGRKNGVPNLAILSRDEALSIEPNLVKDVKNALFAPTGAIISPYLLCIHAVGSAMDNGARLKLCFEVASIAKTHEGAFCVSDARGNSILARYVINCAGIYADIIAKEAGYGSFTITPRRGEYLLLDKDCGKTVTHTVFRCPNEHGKGVLVTPTVAGNLLVGPTAEDIDSKTETQTTSEGIKQIQTTADSQVCGINYRKIITSFAGLRAVGDTGDFIINEKDGFVNVAGIESPGLSASPAIAEYVVDLLRKAGATLEKRDDFIAKYAPVCAFSALSEEEKNKIIQKDPAYGHIVCRCEGVSEGEIRQAIRRNPKPSDVDGVKRRTRATMGRCQGGFCTPTLVKILAVELGVPETSITKRGRDSFLNLGKTEKGGPKND